MPSQMTNQTASDTITVEKEACVFTQRSAVEFTEFADGDKKKNSVTLNLYDGSINNHWYWGNFAFELSSMKAAKTKLPILYRHDTDQRIGFANSFSIEEKLTITGVMLDNELSRSIKADADAGFPFETSLRFDPERSIIENIPEGSSQKVNGKTLKGPGTIIKNALVMEGSVTVFGALKNTRAQFVKSKETQKMSEENENKLKEEKVKIDAAFEKGNKAAGERFEAIAGLPGADAEFAVAQFKAGASVEDAKTALLEKQSAALAAKQQASDTATQQTQTLDPAVQEFSDEQKSAAGLLTKDGKAPVTDEERFEAEWRADPKLQDEFGNDKDGLAGYIAFKKNDAKGLIKIKKG